MKVVNKKYPKQVFEFRDFSSIGKGLVLAYDLQGYLAGIEYAQSQGWKLVIECNETVQIGLYFQAKLIKDVKETKVEKESEVIKVEETEIKESQESPVQHEEKLTVEEEAIQPVTGTGVSINFEELAALQNTKENRKKVDEIAEAVGVELDRRKFQTVEKLVAEFEKQYEGK